MPIPLDLLQRWAREHLFDVVIAWDAFDGSVFATISHIRGQLRKEFGFYPDYDVGRYVWDMAVAWAQVPEGRAVVRQAREYAFPDIDIDPTLRNPHGGDERYLVKLYINVNGVPCSGYAWVHDYRNTEELSHAASDIATDCIADSPDFADKLQGTQITDIYFSVQSIRARY